jgi:hypothetical protein
MVNGEGCLLVIKDLDTVTHGAGVVPVNTEVLTLMGSVYSTQTQDGIRQVAKKLQGKFDDMKNKSLIPRYSLSN